MTSQNPNPKPHLPQNGRLEKNTQNGQARNWPDQRKGNQNNFLNFLLENNAYPYPRKRLH